MYIQSNEIIEIKFQGESMLALRSIQDISLNIFEPEDEIETTLWNCILDPPHVFSFFLSLFPLENKYVDEWEEIFRMSEGGRVKWEPLLHTLLCQAGILGWRGIYVFFGINSGQRGSRSEKPLFLHTEPAHRRWSTWIRKAVKNEKRKKWEESKGTAFSKGKKKAPTKQLGTNWVRR